ncbi:hypothetical protein ONE63_004249 [Megalurothrips usitatus]|uniref:Nuclear protein MDM1 n=1 Tax=Megalurothrips usitatus TaxID=439358 RepID=A0AAV7X7S0_9NEOP|nr:hypothetical protein ONE63_004249 [Megalurothrips usitatus]
MEAAVHSALLAAQRPAAGKLSGAPQSAHQPRKSLSMGALRAQQQQQRSRATDQDRTDDAGESEPLMASQDHGDADDMRGEEKIREDNIGKEDKPRYRKEFKTEYKKKFRPFSQYEYVEGRFMKRREEEAAAVTADPEPPPPPQPQQPWYAEVIELRKKAGEYKHRGWGTELAPEHIAELYSKQMLVWEQVSRRSSLSALSLAAVASPRSISKEEKERENSRRTSPTKAASVQSQPQGRPRPHTAQPKLPGVHERSKSEKARKTEKADDNKKEAGPRSSRKEFPLRHHLERTTGAEDGALLLSPTREKLEPVVPRRKEEPASPKRSQHPGLGQTGRSQSLGPGGGAAAETRSPKRTPRPPSTASAAPAERRPRPTTLNTTAPSRSKSRTSASAPSKGEHQAHKSQPSAGRAASSGTVRGDDKKAVPPKARARPASGEPEPEPEEPEVVDLEPIVKSPPEPTRVKSPEQIIMRSPEPVNWTVPLDTGKTFTVTQNVPDGERLHATPSPAPPAKAPEPTVPAEAEPVLSPSPVPTDTPSPRSPLSPELGSRIASPATLEVMSICQNGGQEGSPPTPADTRPHSPGCADVAVGPAAPAEPAGVLEAAQDTPSPGAGEIGLRDGATSNGPAAENGSETLDDLSALNGRNGENGPTSHTASNGLATEIPNGLNGLNGQHSPTASPTASDGLGTEISNGLNATSVENGHKSVNGLNGSAGASPEPLPAPGNIMTSEIDFFGDLDLGPPPAPVAKTKADPFSLLCDLDDTVADPTQPSPADDKKGVPLHEDDLFGPSLTF